MGINISNAKTEELIRFDEVQDLIMLGNDSLWKVRKICQNLFAISGCAHRKFADHEGMCKNLTPL